MTIAELAKLLNASIDEVFEHYEKIHIKIPNDENYVLNVELIKKAVQKYNETTDTLDPESNKLFKINTLNQDDSSRVKISGRLELPIMNKKKYNINSVESKTENTTLNKKNKTQSVKYEKIDPIDAFGILIFFDYNQNNYGFISNIRSKLSTQPEKVYVPNDGIYKSSSIFSEPKILKGEAVLFTLNCNEKGFFATNVCSLKRHIKLDRISQFQDLVSLEELNDAIYNSIKFEYIKLTTEDKNIILKVLKNKGVNETWTLLTKIDIDGEYTNNYIVNFITYLNDCDKINLLKISFNVNLFEDLLNKWNTKDKIKILELVEVIGNFDCSKLNIPKSFVNNLNTLELNFDEVWCIYSVFKTNEFIYKLLNSFSFKSQYTTQVLKVLETKHLISQIYVLKLQNILTLEYDNIVSERLINLYDKLLELRIIENENKLLELILEKTLIEENIETLINTLSDNCNLVCFRKIISNNIYNIFCRKLINFLDLCIETKKENLGKILLEEYCQHLIENDKSDFPVILSFIKNSNSLFYKTHFLETFYKYLSTKYPLEVLELALTVKSNEALKFAYINLYFNSENEILDFNRKFIEYNLTEIIKDTNKPLTAFFSILNSNSNYKLCENIKKFMNSNIGIVQCLLVKFLIFQFYEKNISKNNLKEIFNSFDWSDISAVVIKTFVHESFINENILLDKLNEIFYTHFKILSIKKFSPQLFSDNFTIKNILNRCDGRKYYNGNLWQANGISRWYYDNSVTTSAKEIMNCYCEGRLWKSESFWNSETNLSSNEKYDFFWCKTSYCAKRNDNINLKQHYSTWTVSEILEVLNIKLEAIALATLSGWANRMNQIVKHLICRNCNEILRPFPFRPHTLGRYAVPLFHCINDKCSNNEIIRFTHCSNNKCESHKKSEPLDSRNCNSCKPNDDNHTGLKCNYCGTGCPTCEGNNNRIIVQKR